MKPNRESTGQNMVRLADNYFFSWAPCFSKREHKSLCWALIILEQALTMPFKLFLSLTDDPLNQYINENLRRLNE